MVRLSDIKQTVDGQYYVERPDDQQLTAYVNYTRECSLLDILTLSCHQIDAWVYTKLNQRHRWADLQNSFRISRLQAYSGRFQENSSLPPTTAYDETQRRVYFSHTEVCELRLKINEEMIYTIAINVYFWLCVASIVVNVYFLWCCRRVLNTTPSFQRESFVKRGTLLIYRSLSDMVGLPCYLLLLVSFVTEYSSDFLDADSVSVPLHFAFFLNVCITGFVYSAMAILRLIAISRPLVYQISITSSTCLKTVLGSFVIITAYALFTAYAAVKGDEQLCAYIDRNIYEFDHEHDEEPCLRAEITERALGALAYLNLFTFCVVLTCWAAVLAILCQRDASALSHSSTRRAFVQHKSSLMELIRRFLANPPSIKGQRRDRTLNRRYHSELPDMGHRLTATQKPVLVVVEDEPFVYDRDNDQIVHVNENVVDTDNNTADDDDGLDRQRLKLKSVHSTPAMAVSPARVPSPPESASSPRRVRLDTTTSCSTNGIVINTIDEEVDLDGEQRRCGQADGAWELEIALNEFAERSREQTRAQDRHQAPTGSTGKLTLQIVIYLLQSLPCTALAIAFSSHSGIVMDKYEAYITLTQRSPCDVDETQVRRVMITAIVFFVAPFLRALIDPILDLDNDRYLKKVRQGGAVSCVGDSAGTPRQQRRQQQQGPAGYASTDSGASHNRQRWQSGGASNNAVVNLQMCRMDKRVVANKTHYRPTSAGVLLHSSAGGGSGPHISSGTTPLAQSTKPSTEPNNNNGLLDQTDQNDRSPDSGLRLKCDDDDDDGETLAAPAPAARKASSHSSYRGSV